MRGSFVRLLFASCLCILFLGMMMTKSPEESDGCSGHESGMLTITSSDRWFVTLLGPFKTNLWVGYNSLHPKEESKTIKIRAGTYHWIAIPEGNTRSLGRRMRIGMVTVEKDKTTVLTIPPDEL